MQDITEGELDEARRSEPIGRYRTRLLADGVLDEAAAVAIEARAAGEVEAAFDAALAAAPPGAEEAFVDVYADATGVPR
jgi:TPP-dependent pyruvate/acetoin dehydrogenase alpha subunit